jgi:hypothetical protein
MRVWKGVIVAALVATSLASLAPCRAIASCLACDAALNCVATGQGAKFCLQGVLTCTMAIPCWSGPSRAPDSGEEFTTWSLFELAGTTAPGIDPEAGPLAVGEEQRGRQVATGALVDATLAHGRDLAVVLSDAAGDGFAVRRTNAGSRVRLEVLAVTADTPGRVLADAMLGERDRLRVVVRAGGRDRLLVLQAAGVEGLDHPATLARLRASLRDAAHVVPHRAEPLFRVRAL